MFFLVVAKSLYLCKCVSTLNSKMRNFPQISKSVSKISIQEYFLFLFLGYPSEYSSLTTRQVITDENTHL